MDSSFFLSPIMGTEWTAVGKGDSLAKIKLAFGEQIEPGDENRMTTLKLVGEKMTPYDRQRRNSSAFVNSITLGSIAGSGEYLDGSGPKKGGKDNDS